MLQSLDETRRTTPELDAPGVVLPYSEAAKSGTPSPDTSPVAAREKYPNRSLAGAAPSEQRRRTAPVAPETRSTAPTSSLPGASATMLANKSDTPSASRSPAAAILEPRPSSAAAAGSLMRRTIAPSGPEITSSLPARGIPSDESLGAPTTKSGHPSPVRSPGAASEDPKPTDVP